MRPTSKKSSKTKAKPRRAVVKKSQPKKTNSVQALQREFADPLSSRRRPGLVKQYGNGTRIVRSNEASELLTNN
jgi:hypothetical protein